MALHGSGSPLPEAVVESYLRMMADDLELLLRHPAATCAQVGHHIVWRTCMVQAWNVQVATGAPCLCL